MGGGIGTIEGRLKDLKVMDERLRDPIVRIEQGKKINTAYVLGRSAEKLYMAVYNLTKNNIITLYEDCFKETFLFNPFKKKHQLSLEVQKNINKTERYHKTVEMIKKKNIVDMDEKSRERFYEKQVVKLLSPSDPLFI